MEQNEIWQKRLQAASECYQNYASSQTIGRLSEKSVHGILKFYLDATTVFICSTSAESARAMAALSAAV